MMTEVSRTVQGVNPHEYEALKGMLQDEEGFQVTSTGIDSFVAKQGNLMTLQGDYNRNGNILTIVGKFSSWLNPDLEHLKQQILRVVNKDDATDKVQHRPLKTGDRLDDETWREKFRREHPDQELPETEPPVEETEPPTEPTEPVEPEQPVEPEPPTDVPPTEPPVEAVDPVVPPESTPPPADPNAPAPTEPEATPQTAGTSPEHPVYVEQTAPVPEVPVVKKKAK